MKANRAVIVAVVVIEVNYLEVTITQLILVWLRGEVGKSGKRAGGVMIVIWRTETELKALEKPVKFSSLIARANRSGYESKRANREMAVTGVVGLELECRGRTAITMLGETVESGNLCEEAMGKTKIPAVPRAIVGQRMVESILRSRGKKKHSHREGMNYTIPSRWISPDARRHSRASRP
jgi:hypothetical protein